MAFSDYSDQQIFEIWERTSKYIPVSSLKGKTPADVVSNIKKEMEKIEKNREQTQTLIEKGFVERFVETSEGKNLIEIAEPSKLKPRIVISERVPSFKAFELPKRLARKTSAERISVRVSGRFRNYASSTIKITESTWKGKNAVYFYSLRKKKLLTWGLIK